MKKLLVIISCIMAFALCFAFTGCGGTEADATKYQDSPYLGQWVAEEAEYNGEVISLKSLASEDEAFEMELNADGSVRLKFGNKDEIGAWEPTDNGIMLSGDESMTFVNDNGNLTIDYSGVTIIFEKQ